MSLSSQADSRTGENRKYIFHIQFSALDQREIYSVVAICVNSKREGEEGFLVTLTVLFFRKEFRRKEFFGTVGYFSHDFERFRNRER